jgi:hypothetical protein
MNARILPQDSPSQHHSIESIAYKDNDKPIPFFVLLYKFYMQCKRYVCGGQVCWGNMCNEPFTEEKS